MYMLLNHSVTVFQNSIDKLSFGRFGKIYTLSIFPTVIICALIINDLSIYRKIQKMNTNTQ